MVDPEQLEKIDFLIGKESQIKTDASIFLHGVCGIFALALHDTFGYAIEHLVALMDPDGEYDTGEENTPASTLVHIYCVSNDILYDIRGGTSEEDAFFEEFSDWIDGNDDYFSFDPEECRKFVKDSMSEQEYQQLYNAAIKIISEHEDWYVTES